MQESRQQQLCRSTSYNFRRARNIPVKKWCSNCQEYHNNFEEGEGWASSPFGVLTPSQMVTYYCFIGGAVYDITPAAHALGLRGKVLDGRHFKLTLWQPSQANGWRVSGSKGGRPTATSGSCEGGADKTGQGASSRRRGKGGFGKKKRGR